MKVKEQEKASGIEVEERSELEFALEEIIDNEKAANAQLDLEESERKNELPEKANGERNAPSSYGRRKRSQDVVDQTPLTL